jgi:hypothetical protein
LATAQPLGGAPEALKKRGRPPKYEWKLLLDIDDSRCGLRTPCSGKHGSVWELTRGSDFPADMKITSLQTAMHAKALYLGIKCHTRKQHNGLQVQFFIPRESSVSDTIPAGN